MSSKINSLILALSLMCVPYVSMAEEPAEINTPAATLRDLQRGAYEAADRITKLDHSKLQNRLEERIERYNLELDTPSPEKQDNSLKPKLPLQPSQEMNAGPAPASESPKALPMKNLETMLKDRVDGYTTTLGTVDSMPKSELSESVAPAFESCPKKAPVEADQILPAISLPNETTCRVEDSPAEVAPKGIGVGEKVGQLVEFLQNTVASLRVWLASQ